MSSLGLNEGEAMLYVFTIKRICMKKRWCCWGLITFAILLGGCNQNVQNEILDIDKMYVDSVFLGFEGDLIYPEIIWGNVDTYLLAFGRMNAHLKIKDERLAWDFKSGADLNISENIYDYVTGVWNRRNEKLNSGKYKLELVGNDYNIVPVVQKETIQSRTGQFIFYGEHWHNISLLHQIYQKIADGFIRGSISVYIENIDDASVFQPNYYYGATSSLGRWSYNCDNACFYIGNRVCNYNIMYDADSDLRIDEYWEKVLNLEGLPLISIMNYRYFK